MCKQAYVVLDVDYEYYRYEEFYGVFSTEELAREAASKELDLDGRPYPILVDPTDDQKDEFFQTQQQHFEILKVAIDTVRKRQ